MLTDIEAVQVRLTCRDKMHPMSFASCKDETCERCKGEGSYLIELPWRDFVYEVREELAPPPDSTR